VTIQRKDAVTAKNMPSASTRKAMSSPGNSMSSRYSMTFPSRTAGSMETTMRNLAREAPMVQNSRTLGDLSERRMRTVATRDTPMA
jgi:hypothetical protein